MDPSEDLPDNPPSAAPASPPTTCPLADPEPHILRERISKQLAELAVKEKELVDPIYRKRSELNQLWNASLLVHRLPNELLVQIFTCFLGVAWLDRGVPLWSSHRDRISDEIGWCHFMLVCQHWRAVFVSTPAFWRRIDLKRHVEWTNLCLIRSGAASLDVSIGCRIVSPLEILHHQARRFRTLHLATSQLEMTLAPLFSTPMPLLEDLHLQVDVQLETKPDIQLTSQRLPCLQDLTLYRMDAPQDTSLFAQLRVVSLSRCLFNFSFDAFLDMLVASVLLEELTLRATLSYPSDEWMHDVPVPRRPPISLPRLRTFTVTGHGVIRTSCFLAHLFLPISTNLFVEADYGIEPVGTQALSSINEMLPPNRAAALPILATATEVDLTIWADDYEITCASLPTMVPTRPDSPNTIFALCSNSDHGREWDTFMVHGLADLVKCFRQAPVTSLTVSGKHDYGTADAWKGVFTAFPRLEFLVVGGAYDSRLTAVFCGLHAASTRSTTRADDSSLATVACRNLKQVQVEGLGLVETYVAMEECFRYRGEKGVVLRVLDLTSLFDTDGGANLQERRAFADGLCEAVKRIELLQDESEEI